VRLWRISDFAELSGEGGLVASARWHTVGRRIVYLADHPASALLEMIVNQNLDRGELPAQYQLLAIQVPDGAALAAIEAADLPAGWRHDREITRARGDRWLELAETSLLRVPSAIVPHAFNWLLNPLHGGAGAVAIAEIVRADFDARLSTGDRT
jgi:RES domain-containing protein